MMYRVIQKIKSNRIGACCIHSSAKLSSSETGFFSSAPQASSNSLLSDKEIKIQTETRKPRWVQKRAQRIEQRKKELQKDTSLATATALSERETLPLWSNRKNQAAEHILTPPENSPYKYFAITLKRSPHGLDKERKTVVDKLGFKKTHQTLIRPISATVAGMILKVKEVLKVKNLKSPEEALVSRKPTKGFTVVGNLQGSKSVELKSPLMVFSHGKVVPFNLETGAMYTSKGTIYYKKA